MLALCMVVVSREMTALVLLLVLSILVSCGKGNELEKQIAAIKIKLEKQDLALKQLENITQAQDEKIASLSAMNQKLQQELEQNLNATMNVSSRQKKQFKNLTEQSRKFQEYNVKLQQGMQKYQVKTDEININYRNTTESQQTIIKNLTEKFQETRKDIQKTYSYINKLNSTLQQKLLNYENKIDNINKNITSKYESKWPPFVGNGSVEIHNLDILRFESTKPYSQWISFCRRFAGIERCPNAFNHDQCFGIRFKISVEGRGSLKSGDKVWLHIYENITILRTNFHNYLSFCQYHVGMGVKCYRNNGCKATSETQAFHIYAYGRNIGDKVYNGDLVMIHFSQFYYYDDYITTLPGPLPFLISSNYCPGNVPPPHLSYSICSSNVFRIHKGYY